MADIIYKINNKGTDYNIAESAYCTCATAAATVAKVAYLQGSSSNTFCSGTIPTGVTINVKFTYSNTASNPTLNVNGSGAKSIKAYGTTSAGTSASTSWKAGAIVAFTFDGTYWVMNTSKDENTDDDTKNTAGATANTNQILYPIGAPNQVENSITYTDENVYILNDSILNVNSYNIGDSNEVWFGQSSDGLIGASDGTLFLSSSKGHVFTNGYLDVNGDLYIQNDKLATRSWAIDYITEYMNSGGSDPEEPEEPEVDPNAVPMIIWVDRKSRLNYEEDWSTISVIPAEQFTGHNIRSANLRPYSRYSQNNMYVITVYCASEVPAYSLRGSGAFELEYIGYINNGLGKQYRINFLQPEEEGLIKTYIVNFTTTGTTVSLQFTMTEREYVD